MSFPKPGSFGEISNPLLFTPFFTNDDETDGGEFNAKNFLLLDGEFFMLLDGTHLLLLGS